MECTVIEYGAVRCLVVSQEGEAIADANGARDLIEEALGERANVVAVPVERLDPAFFTLRSGIAGDVIQKVLNYRLKFAVVGDVSSHVEKSEALRDFVVECKRGTDIIFVRNLAELEQRIGT